MGRLLTLEELLEKLTSGNGPRVATLSEALKSPGSTCEVDEDTYSWYLEVLPPRAMLERTFCFGEGDGTFTLFWREAGSFYAKKLTTYETSYVAFLAGKPAHS